MAPDAEARARPREVGQDDHSLEGMVDVHAFVPSDLRLARRGGGLHAVRVQGEELLANWFGWFNRTLEATPDPEDIPWG